MRKLSCVKQDLPVYGTWGSLRRLGKVFKLSPCWRMVTIQIKTLLSSFYVLLTMHLGIISVNKPTWHTIFSCRFISILYMFRATMCPSWELIVSTWHLVYVTLMWFLYHWDLTVHFSLPVCLDVMTAPLNLQLDFMCGKLGSDADSKELSSHQSNIYQVSHWYNQFSWWWAHSCPKHVENRNKHTWKNCASSWFIYKDLLSYSNLITAFSNAIT